MRIYDWQRENAFGPMPREFPPIVGPGRGYIMSAVDHDLLRFARKALRQLAPSER